MQDNVRRIDWTIKTGAEWWSGTDDTVFVDIYRDDHRIIRLNLEPGDTPRLDRGEHATYYWVFQRSDGLGVNVSGTNVPHTEAFSDGIRGHLRTRFVTQGQDAWEALDMWSTVTTGRLRFIPGTIDSSVWEETHHDFFFPGRDILSSRQLRRHHHSDTQLLRSHFGFARLETPDAATRPMKGGAQPWEDPPPWEILGGLDCAIS